MSSDTDQLIALCLLALALRHGSIDTDVPQLLI